VKDLERRLAVARGDAPADVVLRGAHVLSVFTRDWLDVDVAVVGDAVAGLGEYEGTEVLDVSGRYVVPGFIDAHMHIESSKLLVDEFARLVLPFGTTAVVADPHEIANVLGTDGVHWLLDACEQLPLDIYFMASSCVPASRFESPRRPLTIGDLEGLLRRRRVLGLAEMMNFPGVVAGEESELAKLLLARHVDGHAPGLSGKRLNAYAAAGIESDHEAATIEEGRERLRAGMWLLIREASAARNLQALIPLALEYGPERIAFCTDDREPDHIAADGHINSLVREAVAAGVPPESALVMATLNPALYHGLRGYGAVAPGHQADLLVLPDLQSFVPELVLKGGRTVTEIPAVPVPDWVRNTVRLGEVPPDAFRIPWTGGEARVIGLVPGQISTEALAEEPTLAAGAAVADPARDLAKIAVLERHLGTGRIGLGFVRGFGLQRGAFASTIAHDAHNLIVVGADDEAL
jgi:adenine deaminase